MAVVKVNVSPQQDVNLPTSTSCKVLLVGLAAAVTGFLAYNFTYIVHVSHNHLTLHQEHKTSMLRSFISEQIHQFNAIPGGKSGNHPHDIHTSSAAEAGASALTKTSTVESALKQQQEQLDKAVVEEMTRILSTRVCGSPAVDGYSHVVPSCLEESPTNKWFQAYYKAGGTQGGLVAHIEAASDYDGLAVKWGIKNTVQSAEECAAQCLKHKPGDIPGPFSKLPCNAFAYCPEEVCWEPDAHSHSKGDCWLKFTEGPASPEINMRGDLPDDMRQRHPKAPTRTQWTSGVLLPPGVIPSNGTFGPRWKW